MQISIWAQSLRSFQKRGSQKRATDLPLPDSSGKISAFGSYFRLEGFHPVVQQVYRRLLRLHTGFQDSAQFTRSLQLLRLVTGLGKVSLAYATLNRARCFVVTATDAGHHSVDV